MPHISIKHFPTDLSETQQAELIRTVTMAVQRAFKCDEGVISIAIEPVPENLWEEQVYIPEIINRRAMLRKTPNY